ncbi:MAG: hypothetical protein RI897_1124 [Verrucomicrobiota bacterium]|jgi:uncharacterized protein YdcH (DUF465 family)
MEFHHPILLEFPQHKELILKLKEEQENFRKLVDDYHTIDRQICRIERELDTATDQQTEELKKQRLHLKDLVYHEILAATA